MSKKTTELIIESGNDYVIAVKQNQRNLYNHIQRVAATKKPKSSDIRNEKTRDRVTTRKVEVFDDLNGINPDWKGIKSLIKVERTGTRAGKEYREVVYLGKAEGRGQRAEGKNKYLKYQLIHSVTSALCQWGIKPHRLYGVHNRLGSESPTEVSLLPSASCLLQYISSLFCQAKEVSLGIRGHWGIENRLHWVKDVIFNEDDSRIRTGNAPANLSIIRAIALNILRRNGHAFITCAQRFLSNDIDKILRLVE